MAVYRLCVYNVPLWQGGATVVKVGGTGYNFASGANEKKFLTPTFGLPGGGT